MATWLGIAIECTTSGGRQLEYYLKWTPGSNIQHFINPLPSLDLNIPYTGTANPQHSISPTVTRCSIHSSFPTHSDFRLLQKIVSKLGLPCIILSEVLYVLRSCCTRFSKSRSPAMDALRSADAHVATATHPRGNMRWRLQRYNPMARLRWQKNRVVHPVAHQRAHTRARMNSLNPLFYLRRIRNNLSGAGRRRHTTHVI